MKKTRPLLQLAVAFSKGGALCVMGLDAGDSICRRVRRYYNPDHGPWYSYEITDRHRERTYAAEGKNNGRLFP